MCYWYRGDVLGSIYGGVIYPPNQATYFPPAIMAAVIFGPVFAQSWFIGPTGVRIWSSTKSFKDGGERIRNPGETMVQEGYFTPTEYHISDCIIETCMLTSRAMRTHWNIMLWLANTLADVWPLASLESLCHHAFCDLPLQ